jgi:hypothetical protein
MWPALARLAVFSAAVAVAADGRIACQMAAGPDGGRALVTALLPRIATDSRIACQMATGPDGVRALVTALLTRIATDGTVPSAGNAV